MLKINVRQKSCILFYKTKIGHRSLARDERPTVSSQNIIFYEMKTGSASRANDQSTKRIL